MNENNLRLTDVQKKAIKELAKADARSAEQMLSMVINQGLDWIFCEHGENTSPYLGWPKEWKEICEELEQEYKKDLEVNND